MTTRLALLLALTLTLTAHAQDQDAPPPVKKAPDHLAELAWLVGKWTGGGKMHGQDYTHEVTFEWLYGRRFIRSHYVAKMGGKVVWKDSTTLGWDSKKKRLTWFLFGADGSLGGGHYTRPDKAKKEWLVFGSVGEDADFQNSRTWIRLVDADTYETEVQTKKDDKWVTFMSSRNSRVKAPAKR